MNEVIKDLPVVALRGMTILPAMIVHFDISREKSIRAVEQAMLKDQRILTVAQKDAEVSEPEAKDLYRIGTIAVIKQVMRLPKNIFRVLVEGMERAELMELDDSEGYLSAEAMVFEEEQVCIPDEKRQEAMKRSLKDLFLEYAKLNAKMSKELAGQLLELEDLKKLVDQIAINIPLRYEKILEAIHLEERYETLCVILQSEAEVMQIQMDFQAKVKERIDKNQKEYILREQLKLIREELGEDNTLSDADHFAAELKKLKYRYYD